MPRVRDARSVDSESRTDEDLVLGIRAGDETAFAILYDRYFQRLYNFAYTRLRNRADAEEATQDTFTAVFRSIDGYKGTASLLSWVYGIARNTVNNQIRRARAHEQRVERAQAEIGTPGLGADGYSPEQGALVRALRRCDRACAGLGDFVASRGVRATSLRQSSDPGDRGSDGTIERRGALELVPCEETGGGCVGIRGVERGLTRRVLHLRGQSEQGQAA